MFHQLKIGSIILVSLLSCSQRPATVQTTNDGKSATNAVLEVSETDKFQAVKLMLGRSCAPCHNPGGKMYGTLPFDNPEIVRSHRDGILRRLAPEDKKILELWLHEGK